MLEIKEVEVKRNFKRNKKSMKTEILDRAAILKIYKKPAADAYKGTQGHALLIGGSYGKIGSVVLATKAAIKSGCGLATAFIPKCGYEIIQIAVPEAMVLVDKHEKCITQIEMELEPDAIGIGFGIGKSPQTAKAFGKYISKKPALVIDADGLNILAENPDFIKRLLPRTILTPHKGELERLIGKWQTVEEEHKFTSAFSKKHKLIIVNKGAPTVIIDGENIYKNTTGNTALATGGSGDSLTGVITSFLAQGYKPLDAAKLGVYLHGLTADIAVPETGTQSFTASDIPEYLGKAFLELEKNEKAK